MTSGWGFNAEGEAVRGAWVPVSRTRTGGEMTDDPKKNRWPLPEPLDDPAALLISTRACQSCGQGIVWIVTEAGRRMPLSLRTEPWILNANGTVVDAEPSVVTVDGRRLAQSHFADCPQALAWRRKE